MGRLRQPQRDLADTQAIVDMPGEDLADDLGLGLRDLEVGGHPIAARHTPVPIGDLPEDDLALAGSKELPAPVALRDLHPLVLRDRALNLH